MDDDEKSLDRAYVERMIPQLVLPARDPEVNAVCMKAAARQLCAAMSKIDELQAKLTSAGIGVPVDHERNMRALGYGPPENRHNLHSDSDPPRSFAPVANNMPGTEGKIALVDVEAISRSCEAIIQDRPGDASPPTAVISADVLLSVTNHLLDLRRLLIAQHAGFFIDPALAKRITDRGPIVDGSGVADACGSVVEPVERWVSLRRGQILAKFGVGQVVVDGENSRTMLSTESRLALDNFAMRRAHSIRPEIRLRASAIEAGLRQIDGGDVIDVEIRLVLRSLASRDVLGGAVGELVDVLDKNFRERA